MALTKQEIRKMRLDLLAYKCRILWLNLRHGWTTKDQRYNAMMDGQVAVKSSAHHPDNPHTHPVLKEAFDDGAYCARSDLEREGGEEHMERMAATYDAIQREDASDIVAECNDLGLVTRHGVVRLN